MRQLTVHTADDLVAQWRRRALRWRVVWGDVGTADAVDACANELQAILDVAIEQEAADHGNAMIEWHQGLRS